MDHMKFIIELRDATGVGMMDCKIAHDHLGFNKEACLEYLRIKGQAVNWRDKDGKPVDRLQYIKEKYHIVDYNIYLDKIVEVKVSIFGGGSRIAVGRVKELLDEDLVLVQDGHYGRQCIDYRDILDIKLLKVKPGDIYDALMGKEE